MPAAPTNIDEVLARLDDIVNQSLRGPGRIGYFTALYATVTLNVKRAIVAGAFQDNARMERLDVVFANRFLDAWDAHGSSGAPSQSWSVAFEALSHEQTIVMQHLLLGMNAHINLDLGIAAATVAPGDAILALKDDFYRINTVLARLVGVVEVKLGEISPRFRKIESIGPNLENRLFNFTMDEARDTAWRFAQSLALVPQDQWPPLIAARDRSVADVGHHLLDPGELIRPVIRWILGAESTDIAYNVQVVGG